MRIQLHLPGYPPNTPYYPIYVALIDAGFDLDEKTGAPMNGNLDYFGPPLQLDEVDGHCTAGGVTAGFANCNGCWPRQLTFGVTCALSGNKYGTPGISGGWEVRPILIRMTGDFYIIACALYDAVYNGASVINMNVAGGDHRQGRQQGSPFHRDCCPGPLLRVTAADSKRLMK
jgi:hypothetical protein